MCECRGTGWIAKWHKLPNEQQYQMRFRACWCQCRTGFGVANVNGKDVPAIKPPGENHFVLVPPTPKGKP